MCANCNEDKEMYNRWLDQQGFKDKGMVGARYSTVVKALPGIGLVVLQETTDRSISTPDGVTELPDAPIAGALIMEDSVEDFIADIIFEMGPDFFLKLMQRKLGGTNE